MKKEKAIKIPVKQRLSSFSDPLVYKILSEKNINLSRTRAFEFLELETFPGERAVREKHVQFLFDEWAAGRFLWHNVSLASAKLGDKIYRINGQHTCWMRVNIPTEKDKDVKAECMDRLYQVDSEEQLRNLYSAFDRGAPRTTGHVSKVMLMGGKAARELNPSILGKLVAGFRLFFCEDWHTVNINPNDLTGMIEQNYCELFNLVGRFVQIHYDENRLCLRAAVIGAMFSTFERNVKASDEFWGAVWSGIGLETKFDARWRLKNFIDTHSHGDTGIGGEHKIGKEDLYRVCIAAWNRWRAGEEVGVLRSTERRVKAKT